MRLLLDTHIYLWAVMDNRKLSQKARTLIVNAQTVFVSSASIWEIAIKSGLGKLNADIDQLVAAITTSGFKPLAVQAPHAAHVRHLPKFHHDPFDRLLIAQALCEPLHLLTTDQQLAAYTDLVLML